MFQIIKFALMFLIYVSGKGNPSGIGDLDLDKTNIIVPKGMEKKGIKVNDKTIDTKSEIQIGKIKVKSPSVQEMKDFLKKNFDLLKKVDPEKFMKIRKELLDPKKGIPKFKKDIANKERALSNMSDPEEAKVIKKQLKECRDELDKLETKLKEHDSQVDESTSLDRTGITRFS